MTTIGTFAIQQAIQYAVDANLTDLAAALKDIKLLYLYTNDEFTANPPIAQAGAAVLVVNSTVTPTTFALEVVNNGAWTTSSVTIDAAIFNNILRPAGGIGNALYLIPRANNLRQIPYVNDGMLVYTRDTGVLNIRDQGQWVPLALAAEKGIIPVGGMIGWQEGLTLPTTGGEWKWCNGDLLYEDDPRYLDLWKVLGRTQNADAPLGQFALPTASNTIIKTTYS